MPRYEDAELNRLYSVYETALAKLNRFIKTIHHLVTERDKLAAKGVPTPGISGSIIRHQALISDAEQDVKRARLAFNARVGVVNDANMRKYEEERRKARLVQIKFSPVHQGDQPYPHVDANKRVDGRKTGDRSGHHQRQSPGYGPDAVPIPVRIMEIE